MKRYLSIFALAVFATQSANASDNVEFGVSLEGGYRNDDLTWGIGLADDSSKVSEISYDDVRIYEIGALFSAKASAGMFSGVYTEFDISWGTIDKGDSSDKDWDNLEDRSQLTNYSYSDVKGDDVLDYSLALGYEFQVSDTDFFIMPLIGYAYSEQNLDIGGGAETLQGVYHENGDYSHSIEANRPIPSDAASYDTEWDGAWLGLLLRYDYGDNVFSFRAEYHDYDYYAVGDWKLSDEYKHPKSFAHKTDGDGYKLSANYAREFAPNWDFIASLNYTDFESDSGEEKNFAPDGTVQKQAFLGADWQSTSVNLGVTYKF